MKFISSVIAICLVLITAKLYVPDATAEDQMTKRQIERIIERCDVTGYVDDDYMYNGTIDC
jgi:hypothetical protein